MKISKIMSLCVAVLLTSLAYFQGLFAQAVTLSDHHKSPLAEVFEKYYIDPSNLIYMPDGLYYCEKDDSMTKVGTLLHDCHGTYVLKVQYQCPLCGRVYTTKEPDDEHGCPLFMYKVHPKIWAK